MTSKAHVSNIGPSSHRSPSSPLPADALEYFSETAARMGNSGASGMMIQSPDGRPAGIFFQPKTASNLGSRASGSLIGRRTSGDGRNHNRVLNSVPSSGSSGNNSSSNGKASPGRPRTPSKKKSTLKSPILDTETKEDDASSSITLPTLTQPSIVNDNITASSLQTRQTFTSNAQMAAASRPSAQPQSGLLIGAGFTPSNRRGGGNKKAIANMEILPPIKVLIVDDNEINVKILSTFLKKRKIQFGKASNGREAVDQWLTGGYHLILMDIQLPVMNGIEATKEIRRLERCANVGPINAITPPASAPSTTNGLLAPKAEQENGSTTTAAASGLISPSTMLNSLKASVIIVALTASVLNSDRVNALAAGCNDFLNKPVNLRWFERKVIEWGSMQYLIGFRDINDDLKRQKRYQSLTDWEVSKSNGLVREGFGTGPDRLAQEMASRLYIGGRKTR